ncbi:aldoxime dehydratase [Kibdelosporangium banguiense]|uniref:Aldoxime dehydratase n=1 Tax=Kibdelosporangium banguiense TaxID=1365924 RepID=A0ABS4TVC5_9PSEU|nr:phenylacetaldoxime dehydratase family protein [Kibdelosporangium banguiense]MBP2327905.1 aldoxime dehydratase [Kibdelosporangium banguiense]
MESAIPPYLTVERTRSSRKSDTFQPPYPSFSARFDPSMQQVVMAYFGVQHASQDPPPVAEAALTRLAGTAGGAHRERARYVDEAGYHTTLEIRYWTNPAEFASWLADNDFWTTGPASPEAGFFLEAAQPTVHRFETLFSNDRVEGIAVAADKLSGEIQEHGYWGGARDRIPLSQTDTLAPFGAVSVHTSGDLVTVVPNGNLCLIRSGQEWSETDGDERRMYLEEVEPVLRAGMDFLRDDGLPIGCYANRYVRVLAEDGSQTDKSFGLSWWRGLEDLETWSESHPTHVAIFRVAMKYLSTMGPAARLRLYHEVTVAEQSQTRFEYLGCHARTGLLRTLR